MGVLASLRCQRIAAATLSAWFLVAAGRCGGQVVSSPSASPEGARTITIHVVVTARSGPPVAGLKREDFTLLDNKAPRVPTSFREVRGRESTPEVLVLIDAVNAPFQTVAFARDQIKQFAGANGGELPYPTSIAVLTDKGTQVQPGSTRSGKELSASVDQADIGLRSIRRSAGFYGAAERYQMSLTALRELAAVEGRHTGRKAIVFVSPGWPLFAGPNAELTKKDQQKIFAEVVALSTQLRASGITLYSVDPIGAGESEFRTLQYEEFLGGVSKAGDAYPGDLGLQVLAVQSGGLALSSSNDVKGSLERCVADLDVFYDITFEAAAAEHRDEYHRLEVRMAEPGLTARTTRGYYAQP